MQQLFEESKVEKQELEKENYDLSGEVQRLMKNLEVSRAKLESHLQSTHDKQDSEWLSREAKLNNVIKGLRRQLRDETSTTRLYRAEMLKSRRLGLEVAKLKQELNGINDARKSKDESNIPPNGPATCDIKAPALLTTTQSDPESAATGKKQAGLKEISTAPPKTSQPQAGKENGVESTKTPTNKNKVTFQGSPKSHERSIRRVEMRRAAGGRKALQEKVKQMRSPGRHRPLRTLAIENRINPV
mmetsp:Transcript_29711/g.81651  ORF Transcript_29711/g.81651 Transcript_29711/m.81651 type:complete len:244 (+) Transcript_29711:180-911(+)